MRLKLPSVRRDLTLRWNILKLRLSALPSGKHGRAHKKLRARLGGQRPPWTRGLPLFLGLGLCGAAALAAVLICIFVVGAPQLRNLDGTLPGAADVLLLDPYRKDETMLTPGHLYDRPIALAQTGAQPVLLRVRLEETLLTVRRDDKGLVIVTKSEKVPGGGFIPRTISREAVLRLLRDGGYCAQGDSWDAVLKKKLPARRLPGGGNDGGRLLVFEKKTTVDSPNAEGIDVSVIAQEDLEQYQLVKTTWSYLGFYAFESDDGTPLYQPLHFKLDDAPTRKTQPEPPVLKSLSYEFFQWDAARATVHLFGAEGVAGVVSPVNLQAGTMQPLSAWTEPADAWFYDTDGWVYYGQTLAPGEMTPLLLESFSVGPDSPLIKDETRYRLLARVQSAPLNQESIIDQWHSGAVPGGDNLMSNEAADFAAKMLEAGK